MNVWVSPGEGDNYMQLSALEVISFISSISSGLFMGIIRLMEPYFLFMLKKELYECFGIPYTEEEIKKGDSKLTDTISAFLNSSLNIELVHIILKAISQEWTKEDKYLNMSFDYNDRTVYDEQKVHEIKEITVDDPQKWRLIDATVPKQNKRFNFNVLDHTQNDDGSLIINENISVEEFAPRVFGAIRREEGIDNDMIRKSLSPENNRDSVFKAGEGQGKSGSFFFFSHDRKFLIKTMNEEEFETFKKLFKNYYYHLLKNKNSLIARIYGIYTVKKEKIEPVRLILMGNTVNTEGKGENLKYMFDLKGSFANRKVKMSKNHKASSTLKDINLLEIKKQENILKFTEEDKDRIMSMIYKDVPLLRQANIMDYSLLLAIEQNPMFRENHLTHHISAQRLTKENEGSKSVYSDHGPSKNDNSFISMRVNPRDAYENQRHMFLSSDFKFIYHIAIIDYLQDYNYDKKMENLVKTLLKGDSAEISAVPPHRYSTRYMNFMSKEVILTEKKKK